MEAVLPSGLVAVLIRKLMEDITEGAPDICTTYYDYITGLVGQSIRHMLSMTVS